MAGFKNIREVIAAQDAGRYLYASFRKQPTQTTASGIWFDMSMSPGNPAPNYYIGVPGVFTPLKQSTDGGLRHGGNVNTLGQKKFLRNLMVMTPTATAAPSTLVLMDYIGFYPFIDESVTDEQLMDNATAPTRYADGSGVMMMPVVVAAHSGAVVQLYVKYTNQAGVTGRISQTITMGTQLVSGTVRLRRACRRQHPVDEHRGHDPGLRRPDARGAAGCGVECAGDQLQHNWHDGQQAQQCGIGRGGLCSPGRGGMGERVAYPDIGCGANSRRRCSGHPGSGADHTDPCRCAPNERLRHYR